MKYKKTKLFSRIWYPTIYNAHKSLHSNDHSVYCRGRVQPVTNNERYYNK